MHEPASDSLANRYGRTSRISDAQGRRWWRIGGVVFAVVATIMVFIWTWSMTEDILDYKDVGYTITSPAEASVRFQLTKEPEATVACAVEVLADNYAVVGYKTVVVGPDETGPSSPSDLTNYYDVDLRTDSLGVSGTVNDCWYYEDGPSNLSYFDIGAES